MLVTVGAVGYLCWRRRRGGYEDMTIMGNTYNGNSYQSGGVESSGTDRSITPLRDGEEL